MTDLVGERESIGPSGIGHKSIHKRRYWKLFQACKDLLGVNDMKQSLHRFALPWTCIFIRIISVGHDITM